MNFLSGKIDGDGFHIDGMTLDLPAGRALPPGEIKLGIRPEYVSWSRPTPPAIPMTVSRVLDVGTSVMLSANGANHALQGQAFVRPGDIGSRRFGLAAGHGRSHLLLQE